MPQNEPLKTRTAAAGSEAESQAMGETQASFQDSDPTTIGDESGQRLGNFLLIERLGEGGFGTVWRAKQLEPVKREVALKILKPGMDSREIVARFSQERQALAVMDHPAIAKVLDAGLTGEGRPYFVMELVRGSPINSYCDAQRLNTHARLKLFIQVCLGVQHAHQKGVIHRDLKPSNILVCETNAGPQPKIIDFGIAKATSTQLTDATLHTQIGQFIGTPAYMSPEQADGLAYDLDTRADVYSLGVVLYQLLTGNLPFDFAGVGRAGTDEIRRRIREQTPARPSTRLRSLSPEELLKVAQTNGLDPGRMIPSVRGDLDWIIMKALEKDRARRYDTAQDFAADIRRFLEHQPILARPPSTGYLLRRFVTRNRGSVAAASAILLTLVAALILSTALFFREATARAKADSAAVKAQQVAGFLKRMLVSVGPSKAQGRDATMLREILDSTAAELTEELAGQPEVEAEIRFILGSTYEDLGEYKSAKDMYAEALRLQREVLPEKDPLIADSLFAVASALDYLDHLDEAERTLYEAIEFEQQTAAPRWQRLGEGNELLAWVLTRKGNLGDAEKYARQALEIFSGADKESIAGHIRTLNALGLILLKTARYVQGEEIHRLALKETRDLYGDMHPKVITAMNNLGNLLNKIGKHDEAEQLANDGLQLERKITGKPIGPCTDSLHKVLAGVYEARKEYDRAIDALKYAIQTATELYGANHRFTNDKRSLLARVQVKAGLLDDAEQTLHEAHENGGGQSAENSLEIAAAALGLARGNLELAEKEARKDLERARSVSTVPTTEIVDAMQILAAVLASKGNHTEAEKLLLEAIEIMKPAENPSAVMLNALQEDLKKLRASD